MNYHIHNATTFQQDEFHLKWSPDDLTQQDVASLYSAQADSWTLVDEFSEFKNVMLSKVVMLYNNYILFFLC